MLRVVDASGAKRFCGRHEWEGQIAYASQFDTPIDRAHRGKARIKAKLIGAVDPDEWDFPPKPKWMRWRTYEALERKFDACESDGASPMPVTALCLSVKKRQTRQIHQRFREVVLALPA